MAKWIKRATIGLAGVLGVFLVTVMSTAIVQSQLPGMAAVPASQIFGQVVRGVVAGNAAEGVPIGLVGNNRGDQIVAQGLPANTELVRLGNSYQVITSTAATAATATPTTTSLISLWNGEPAGGKSYIIDSVFWIKLIIDATTASGDTAMWCMNNVSLPITAPATALTPKSLSGRRNYAGRGLIGVGVTVTNDGWYPIGTSMPFSGALASSLWQTADYPVNGTILVPPTGMFSCSLTELTATASKYQLGMRFHEAQLTLGF